MEINTHNAEILLSAANKSHYPQDDIPEIALAGRSNVGKSSFINTMLNRKNLARTSGKPGKTQLLNFFNIDDKLRFVDVPGYGYAKVSKTERAKWGRMIEEYLTSRENLRAVVSLVDLRHDPSADDVQMYEFLKYYEIPVILVATKADKIPRGKSSNILVFSGLNGEIIGEAKMIQIQNLDWLCNKPRSNAVFCTFG